jgi:hypothetical protein
MLTDDEPESAVVEIGTNPVFLPFVMPNKVVSTELPSVRIALAPSLTYAVLSGVVHE